MVDAGERRVTDVRVQASADARPSVAGAGLPRVLRRCLLLGERLERLAAERDVDVDATVLRRSDFGEVRLWVNEPIEHLLARRTPGGAPGRAYYLRKQIEGKSKKDALRALKRRVSDAVYRELLADSQT